MRGLIEAVLLGIFRACPIIYISVAPDMQGDRAKSNTLLVRCGLGCGWRLVGREWPRLVGGWFPSVTVLTVRATQSNSSKPHGPKRSRCQEPPVQLAPCCSAIFCPHTGFVGTLQESQSAIKSAMRHLKHCFASECFPSKCLFDIKVGLHKGSPQLPLRNSFANLLPSHKGT